MTNKTNMTNPKSKKQEEPSLHKALERILSKRMFVVLIFGFSSGLPLLLTGSTMKAWLKEENIDITQIGMTSLLGMPYTLKFLWSPFFDFFKPPIWGLRRGWIIIAQIVLMLSIVLMSLLSPQANTQVFMLLAFLVAFFSATQDILIDAYRREILPFDELAFGSSVSTVAYQFALLISGGLALYMADHMSWREVYMIMGLSLLLPILTTWFWAPEPPHPVSSNSSAADSDTIRVDNSKSSPSAQQQKRRINLPLFQPQMWIQPIQEFLERPQAWLIVGFILFYKLGDSMASQMTMPLYLDSGFSKSEIAKIVKGLGVMATIGGVLLGGALTYRWGLRRSLWIFGILQAISTLGFSYLAHIGSYPIDEPIRLQILAAVIAFENLSSGMGSAAFTTYMAAQTNLRFTATQYSLLSSLMGVPRVIFGAPTGWMIKQMGYVNFFEFCAFLAVPGLFLLFKLDSRSQAELLPKKVVDSEHESSQD